MACYSETFTFLPTSRVSSIEKRGHWHTPETVTFSRISPQPFAHTHFATAPFDLTIDILNTNNDKNNKIDLLRPFQQITIERNDVLGCSMVLEQNVNDKGQPLTFGNEKCRCLREIKIGFDRSFGVSTTWVAKWVCAKGWGKMCENVTVSGVCQCPRFSILLGFTN
jgi:hypothetical protein